MPDLFGATRTRQPAARPAPAGSARTTQAKITQAMARDAAHCCRVCGAWAGFGFKNPCEAREPYRWGCGEHRDQVEAMGA